MALIPYAWYGFVILYSVLFGAGIGYVTWDSYSPFATMWDFFHFAGFIFVGLLVGLISSIIPGSMIFPPFYTYFLKQIGGPIKTGEIVKILSGPLRDRTVRVCGQTQGMAVRVELSDEERKKFKDIFSPHQLIRVTES